MPHKIGTLFALASLAGCIAFVRTVEVDANGGEYRFYTNDCFVIAHGVSAMLGAISRSCAGQYEIQSMEPRLDPEAGPETWFLLSDGRTQQGPYVTWIEYRCGAAIDTTYNRRLMSIVKGAPVDAEGNVINGPAQIEARCKAQAQLGCISGKCETDCGGK